MLDAPPDSTYILIGSGSGFGYLLDVLGYLAHRKRIDFGGSVPKIDVHFTVRSETFLSQYK